MKPRFIYLIPVLSLAVLASGCAGLRRLDDKAGELLNKIPQAEEPAVEATAVDTASGAPEVAGPAEKAASTDATGTPAEGKLTEAIKNKIDLWLEGNGLNRFGDATDTMYTGGTPLFNEITGKSADRFEYLLRKIPDLLEKIKN